MDLLNSAWGYLDQYPGDIAVIITISSILTSAGWKLALCIINRFNPFENSLKRNGSPVGILPSPGVDYVFWLGHDLIWTCADISKKANVEKIIHGLNCSKHHLIKLGLADTPYTARINEMLDELNSTVVWNYKRRNLVITQLRETALHVGIEFECSQN